MRGSNTEAIAKLHKLTEQCPLAPEDVDIQRGIRRLVLTGQTAEIVLGSDRYEYALISTSSGAQCTLIRWVTEHNAK